MDGALCADKGFVHIEDAISVVIDMVAGIDPGEMDEFTIVDEDTGNVELTLDIDDGEWYS